MMLTETVFFFESWTNKIGFSLRLTKTVPDYDLAPRVAASDHTLTVSKCLS